MNFNIINLCGMCVNIIIVYHIFNDRMQVSKSKLFTVFI